MTELLFWPFVAGLVLTLIHAWFGLHVLARGVVFVDLSPEKAQGAVERLRARGVLATGLYRLRLATHLDVSAGDIERAVVILRESL